ncbi:MAG: hypothetical protein K6C68_05110 [Ruminococcus sp.]|nr:hypothetical protein [Ruminococcus sp.]
MNIRTQKARDTPETNIERDGIETQKLSAGVRNTFRIKSIKKTGINNTSENRNLVLKNPNVNREERLRQLRDIDHRKGYFKSRKLKLARKKYITANGDDESPNNITTVQSTLDAAGGVVQTGGVIRTAVGDTRNTAGRIQTTVKNGVRIGSAKDVRNTLSSASTVAKDATIEALNEGCRSLLQTKIDKSTTTDTGMEAVKQGLTELRYVENARRGIYNASQGGIKTARSIRETPKAVKQDAQKIRKIRENIIRKNHAKQVAKSGVKAGGKVAGEAAKKSVSVIAKVVTSKGFIVVALGAILILLCVNLVSGFLSMILTTIASMFSWMDPKDPNVDKYKYLQAYHVQVQEAEAVIQADLDDVFTYTPEYRYDGSEITSLNQYGNTQIAVDENGVIAASALVEFKNGNDKLSDETIADMTDKFYEYWHDTETGYCPDHDCMKEESTLTAANGDFYVSNTAYVASSNEYAVSFRGTCYEHTSSVMTDLTIVTTDDGSITGSCGAGVCGSDWEVTYNIGAEGFNKIDWNDITIKTTTIYCDNPNHNIFKGEVTNLDCETALKKLGFTDDEKNLFWTFYYALEQEGF